MIGKSSARWILATKSDYWCFLKHIWHFFTFSMETGEWQICSSTNPCNEIIIKTYLRFFLLFQRNRWMANLQLRWQLQNHPAVPRGQQRQLKRRMTKQKILTRLKISNFKVFFLILLFLFLLFWKGNDQEIEFHEIEIIILLNWSGDRKGPRGP